MRWFINTLARIAVVIAIAHFSFVLPQANADLLTNADFETPFSTNGVLPTTAGVWDADPASSVTSLSGITPLQGTRMLQFEFAAPVGPSTLKGSSVWQLVDLTNNSAVSNGSALANLSSWFNRVAGDSETDTLFRIEIRAFSGLLNSFPLQVENSELAVVTSNLISDSDVTSWERLDAQLLLPTQTDFIAIHLSARENVVNDSSGVEFDGHFADTASLTITAIPEPSTFALLSIGGLALVGYGWRRKRELAA